MEDIAHIFALEVKQELASRYFGFRKQIEDDINRYQQRLGVAGKEHLLQIVADLQVIRNLLGSEQLFEEFLDLLQYPKVLVARILRDYGGQVCHIDMQESLSGLGFTRRQRLRSRFYKLFGEFRQHVLQQYEVFVDLHDEYDEICGEIKQFYRQNDINSILDFLRQIDTRSEQSINAPPDASMAARQQQLEDDLRISPPPPVESALEALAPPPPVDEMKKKLATLLDKVVL